MVTTEDIAIAVLIASFVALVIVIVWLQLYLRSPPGQRWRLSVRYDGNVDALIEIMDKFRIP